MSKKIRARGVIEGGTLRIIHERDFLARLGEMKGSVSVTVERETRTMAQNNYLWAMNTKLANELGWTAEEVHEYSKSRWNQVHKTRVDKATGEIRDVSFPGTTHDKSIDAMAEYIDAFIRGWAEEGYSLESPEEYYANLEKEP